MNLSITIRLPSVGGCDEVRQVLDCASPLALFYGSQKRQRAAALHDAVAQLQSASHVAA